MITGRRLLVLEKSTFERSRASIYLEFHGIRLPSSHRALVTRKGHKYILNADDFDEAYDLNADPGELDNLIASPKHAGLVNTLREAIKRESARVKDPLADYIAKLLGDWENLSGQFEAASKITGRKGD